MHDDTSILCLCARSAVSLETTATPAGVVHLQARNVSFLVANLVAPHRAQALFPLVPRD